MKVFISWSGKRSKALANALRDWLPMVLQYVEPWVSDKDISAGDRWAQAIAGELEASNFGIICITPENLHSEWILFESGALSKSMLDAKVIPLLFGLEMSDLSGPLSQFQAQKMEESGLMEVAKSINNIAESKTSDQIVEQLVPALWPRLQEALENIPDSEPSEKHMRPHHEILEELVTGVRGINSRMRDFEPDLLEHERVYKRRKMRRIHPRMLEEISMMAGEEGGAPLQLLVLAGLYREDLPWLAEILTEAYREIRDGSPDTAERTLTKVRRMLKHMMHSKMFYELSGGSKELMMLTEELPMILDMAMHRLIPDRPSSDDQED
ncbi:MAG: toll/interleukin-1 receptor domain-containing protein [Candidatus Thiodiazotropha endolucinida]|nr:toll/interleukin-1 receptor domain-containing protein [Candidatus Thiodiazotropha taylori]MCW4318033.1 toll/interleukin-1 receptor domain-containing protein [Candidatus Thiodiazotropha taylori]